MRDSPHLRNALHAAGLLENGSGGRSSSVRVRNAVDGSTQQGGLHDSCTRDLGRKDGQQDGLLLRWPRKDGLRPRTGNKAARQWGPDADAGARVRPRPAAGPVAKRGPGHLHGQARGRVPRAAGSDYRRPVPRGPLLRVRR